MRISFLPRALRVEPDIFTCAKALGGGVPIGAICAKDFVASAFSPGDHGTTFGGNPLACAAGLAVFKAYEEENLVENSKKMGELFLEKLNALKVKYPDLILDIRGAGLLIGIEPKGEFAADIYKKLFENKILTSNCYGTIRIAPPLNITEKEIDIFIDTLDNILGGF